MSSIEDQIRAFAGALDRTASSSRTAATRRLQAGARPPARSRRLAVLGAMSVAAVGAAGAIALVGDERDVAPVMSPGDVPAAGADTTTATTAPTADGTETVGTGASAPGGVVAEVDQPAPDCVPGSPAVLDVVAMNLADATRALSSLGFQIRVVETITSVAILLDGVVYEQIAEGGAPGSTVELHVWRHSPDGPVITAGASAGADPPTPTTIGAPDPLPWEASEFCWTAGDASPAATDPAGATTTTIVFDGIEPAPATVPRLDGLLETEAVALLAANRLQADIIEQPLPANSRYDGRVLAQSPITHDQLQPAMAVMLVVGRAEPGPAAG